MHTVSCPQTDKFCITEKVQVVENICLFYYPYYNNDNVYSEITNMMTTTITTMKINK